MAWSSIKGFKGEEVHMAVICDAMDIEEQETYLEPLSNFPESTFSVGRGLLGNLRHIRRKNCQLHLPNAKPIVL